LRKEINITPPKDRKIILRELRDEFVSEESKRILRRKIMVYYVYVLRNTGTGMMYIGSTSNLKRRFLEHQEGKSLFTRKNKKGGKWQLVYFEGYPNKADAKSREKFLKGGSGRNYLKKQLKNYFNNFGPV